MGWLYLGVSGVLARELGKKKEQRTKDNFSSSCNYNVGWSEFARDPTLVWTVSFLWERSSAPSRHIYTSADGSGCCDVSVHLGDPVGS